MLKDITLQSHKHTRYLNLTLFDASIKQWSKVMVLEIHIPYHYMFNY